MINTFIYGQSGSGKDILSTLFKNKHLYLKFRCAGTIKQIICEKNGFAMSQLEKEKRSNEAIRKEHWKVGDWMGKDHKAVIQRLSNIVKRDSCEFDIMPESVKRYPILIEDVRLEIEADYLLSQGFNGVFLTRLTSEFKNKKHKTENDLFSSGAVKRLCEKYPDQCVIIVNSEFENREQFNEYVKVCQEKCPKALNILCMYNPDGDLFLKTISENFTKIFPNIFFDEGDPRGENQNSSAPVIDSNV